MAALFGDGAISLRGKHPLHDLGPVKNLIVQSFLSPRGYQ